jgi:hypothetical protein
MGDHSGSIHSAWSGSFASSIHRAEPGSFDSSIYRAELGYFSTYHSSVVFSMSEVNNRARRTIHAVRL